MPARFKVRAVRVRSSLVVLFRWADRCTTSCEVKQDFLGPLINMGIICGRVRALMANHPQLSFKDFVVRSGLLFVKF